MNYRNIKIIDNTESSIIDEIIHATGTDTVTVVRGGWKTLFRIFIAALQTIET
jgi:hypothetical protein